MNKLFMYLFVVRTVENLGPYKDIQEDLIVVDKYYWVSARSMKDAYNFLKRWCCNCLLYSFKLDHNAIDWCSASYFNVYEEHTIKVGKTYAR